ncbi:MAG: FHA domain-containing protein [Planctomycetes bacterium]|nr:FHA domain-containing protein [Planctomycetota bacterium]
MPAVLVSTGSGPSIPLDKPVLLLGRQEECDIVLDSRKVSRKHCCLAVINGTVIIRDLASTNGIAVNGKRVTHATLAPGDIVSIGGHAFRLKWDSLSGSPDKPVSPVLPQSVDSGFDKPVPIPEPSPSHNSSGGNLLAIA